MPSETRLVEECAAGSRAAQKALYDRYCDPMLIVCLRYIANEEDAREALMDGFYNCFRSIGGFRYAGAGSLKAWLKKIVVNCCLMHLRRRVAPVTELEEATGGAVDDGVLARLSAKELLGLIRRLLASKRWKIALQSPSGPAVLLRKER